MSLVILLVALLLPAFAHAHVVPGAVSAPSAAKTAPDNNIGVDERLGARIPLDLVFRDESGNLVRLSQLVTGPTIILPVYYRCSNVCNFLQGDLARVLPEIKRVPGAEYRVLSVSIDETETPQVAAGAQRMYLAAINAPFPRTAWRFLTGDAVSIRRLTDAAGFHFQRRGAEFMHPVASFVVAGDGTIVRYLYGTSFLAKDVSLAFIEAAQGRVGTTIKKVAAYCFSFDQAKKSYQFNLLRVAATAVILCSGGFFLFLVLSGRRGKNPSGGK